VTDRGQASVELIGVLPLLVVVAMGLGQALAFGSARESAKSAAHAGALAIAQNRDPNEAVRSAVPDLARARLVSQIDGRRVRVLVRPKAVVPGLAGLFQARASADAGAP
jgi:hypothetical protein